MKKGTEALLKSRDAALALLFFSFVFLQLTFLRLGNQAGSGWLPDEWGKFVYVLIQAAVIGGFALHLPAYRLFGEKRGYGISVSVSALLLAACTLFLLFAPSDSAAAFAVTASGSLLLGFLCGAVYTRMSAVFPLCGRPGLCTGLGYASAIALQYVIQLRFTVRPLIACFTVLCVCVPVFLFLRGREEDPGASGEDAPVEKEKTGKAGASRLVCAVLITVAMLVFVTYFNTYVHNLQVVSGYAGNSAYSWPRLILIPGMVLFGFLGDVRGGKYLPVGTLCVAVVAILNILLTGSETHSFNMCLYYLSLSAAVAYYHMTFLRLASRTGNPALWAGTGRMLDSAAVFASVLLGFSDLPGVAVLAIDIAALVVIIVLMAAGGDLNLSRTASARTETANTPEPVPLDGMKDRFGLTPSEMKVLRELVGTDDKQEAIAARLRISVSTVRHHITSIYKKTGTQTRTALCKLVSDVR